MKITLHIGVEKTGSTSIQTYLTRNREALLKKGILYAQSLSLPNNDFLVAFSHDPNKKSDIRAKYTIPDSANEIEKFKNKVDSDLREEIEKHNPSRLIISNEHLTSRLGSVEELDRVFDFLYKFSDDIELLIYLRRQDSLLESLYSTAMIAGNTYDFNTYLRKLRNRHDLHYYSLLKMWERFIPKEKMKIRIFEKEKLLNQDIVDDFLDQVGIVRENRETIEENISLGYKKIEFLRRFNLLIPLSDKKLKHQRGNILQLLYKAPIEDDKIRMSKEQRVALLSFCADENHQCADYYLGKSKLFDEQIKDYGENSFTVDDLMEIFYFAWKNKQLQIAVLARENQLLQLDSISTK